MRALGTTHEQEVGDVHAYQHQHESDRAEHHLERPARRADDVGLERIQPRPLAHGGRILAPEQNGKTVQLGLRLVGA